MGRELKKFALTASSRPTLRHVNGRVKKATNSRKPAVLFTFSSWRARNNKCMCNVICCLHAVFPTSHDAFPPPLLPPPPYSGSLRLWPRLQLSQPPLRHHYCSMIHHPNPLRSELQPQKICEHTLTCVFIKTHGQLTANEWGAF